MNRTSIPAYFLATLFISTLIFQAAQAQDFIDTTINPGTNYDSNGLGVYDLTGGELVLDGSEVLGSGTTIQWTVPDSGGTLEFNATKLTTTDGDLSITGDPISYPSPFTLSSGGSLEINDHTLTLQPSDPSEGGTIILSNGGSLSLFGGGTGTISATGGTLTLNGTNIPLEDAPEPSTWILLIGGTSLLTVMSRRKLS